MTKFQITRWILTENRLKMKEGIGRVEVRVAYAKAMADRIRLRARLWRIEGGVEMARWVKKTKKQPARMMINGKKISICRCGLSNDENGFCVGLHTKVQDEEEGKCYCYDENGERVEVGCGCEPVSQ